jgi:hypothetical protein
MFQRSAIICLGGITVGFLAGAVTSAARGWGSPVVSLDVVNRSGKPAQSVTVEYESCGTKSVLPGRRLAGGEATKFQFLVCGEGSYLVMAHIDDGAELRGHEAYVEAGYRATEVLLSREIQSSVDSHPY